MIRVARSVARGVAGRVARRLPGPAGILWLALLAIVIGTPAARAERMQRLGSYEVHYSLIPTLMLKPDIAAGYGISRSRDRALLNVSVIDPATGPVKARVDGVVRDLLGLTRTLEFQEVVEGEAVYYLATLRHDDQETLRFDIGIATPDGQSHRLEFQQKMYREAP